MYLHQEMIWNISFDREYVHNFISFWKQWHDCIYACSLFILSREVSVSRRCPFPMLQSWTPSNVTNRGDTSAKRIKVNFREEHRFDHKYSQQTAMLYTIQMFSIGYMAFCNFNVVKQHRVYNVGCSGGSLCPFTLDTGIDCHLFDTRLQIDTCINSIIVIVQPFHFTRK